MCTVGYGLSVICIGMWRDSIWTWRSCGSVVVHHVASLEHFLPPWTVIRRVWSDSLKSQHSGISTDVLLFSDIHLSLVHHYRIHKHGLPHVTFWRNYLSQLGALLPLQVAQPADGVVSPDSSGSGSLRSAESPEVVEKSPRTTRRAYRRRRPVRVMEPSVENVPVLTIQDPSAAAGAVVCRLSVSVATSDYGH